MESAYLTLGRGQTTSIEPVGTGESDHPPIYSFYLNKSVSEKQVWEVYGPPIAGMDRLLPGNEGEIHPPVVVECYVRTTAPGMLVDNVISTIRTYDEEGVFEECTIASWPNKICLTDGRAETGVLPRYWQFQDWADSEGVSLEPAFTCREQTSMVSDTAESVLVLPVLSLAIRIDGELVSVAPHTTETTLYTVGDALADIEALSRSRSRGIEEFSPDDSMCAAPTSFSPGDQSSRTSRGGTDR